VNQIGGGIVSRIWDGTRESGLNFGVCGWCGLWGGGEYICMGSGAMVGAG
jgi:hypothetical protein